jgi:hypothetical protein
MDGCDVMDPSNMEDGIRTLQAWAERYRNQTFCKIYHPAMMESTCTVRGHRR